jgi:hypothetical protein
MTGKPGRPPKEPGERMTVPLRIMLTESHAELIRQAAGEMDVSTWARMILLEAAKTAKDKVKTKKGKS